MYTGSKYAGTEAEMHLSTYLTVMALLLGASGWLDAFFTKLRINKAYALMALLSCLSFSAFDISPIAEFDMNISAVLIMLIMLTTALQSGEYSIVRSLICKTGVCLLIMTGMIFADGISLLLIMVPTTLLISLFMKNKPIFASSICVSVPLIVYILSLFAETLLDIEYSAPSMQATLDAQILSLMLSLSVSYIAKTAESNIAKHKKTEGNL